VTNHKIRARARKLRQSPEVGAILQASTGPLAAEAARVARLAAFVNLRHFAGRLS
jgi:hypothetical protein